MQRNRVRPDPVSCQSCRSKKLKCNRAQPCSNCAARGITCNFLVPPQGPTITTSTVQSSAELRARIDRLESIVLNQTGPTDTHSTNPLDDSRVARQQPLYRPPRSIVLPNIDQKRDQDSRWLENVGTREDSLLPPLSNSLVLKISGAYELHATQADLQHSARSSNIGPPNDTIAIFPTYRIATLLFQSYESNVDHLCRILHIPTLRSLVRTVYLQITQNEPVLPGQAALLLSLFALAAYFYQPFAHSEVAITQQDAIHLSKALSRGALDVLDYSRRNTSGILEDVQAYVLISLVTYHLDGFSARGRLLSTAALSIARELRLHQLDANNESSATENETNPRTLVDREVKRRVFWHIASTDWLFATISGPQEGMYFIHPNHVNVKLPKDCNDDDLIFFKEIELTIAPQPTGMTFFLERVRLAHLCREMADTVPLETSKLLQLPYEKIIALDRKLQDFNSSLPFFFKLDAKSRRESKALEAMYPAIPISRYCITIEAHSRRCKLHQRFLLRQSTDPRYAYSRHVCLESARVVLQAYADLRCHDVPSTVPELMGMAVHFTHLALVVMVMDLCFNRDAADEAEIKAEVKKTLQMFEDAGNVSPLLERFLGSLTEVLRKHEVLLADPTTLEPDSVAGFAQDSVFGAFSNSDEHGQLQAPRVGQDMDAQEPGFTLDTSFEDFWQAAIQGEPNPDSLSWDNLFSALDSRPL